jgi:predicted acetyltransferase
MTEDLAGAAARGVPLAALTVSEGSIYGRFGFGAATWLRQVEVDAGPRFALRPEIASLLARDPGRYELVEPGDAWPAVREVMAAVHQRTRGSVERPGFYEPILTGSIDFDTGEPDPRLRALVHLDAGDRPDGYVVYRPVEVDGRDVLEVRDLMACDPATHLGLWRFLAEMDLVTAIRSSRSPVDDVLDHALADPRAVRVVGIVDLLWVRVLDVVGALAARPWYGDGEVVLEVDDPLGHAAGRWSLRVDRGAAQVTPTTQHPQVRMSADALGSLYLGGVGVRSLHAAARVSGDPAAVSRLAGLADGGPAPHCVTPF